MPSQRIESTVVDVRYERYVGNGELAGYKPFLLGQDGLEDAEHSLHLVLVPLNGRGDLLGVIYLEPGNLSEVRAVESPCKNERTVQKAEKIGVPLTRGLEKDPLEDMILVLIGSGRVLLLGVVFVHEIH